MRIELNKLKELIRSIDIIDNGEVLAFDKYVLEYDTNTKEISLSIVNINDNPPNDIYEINQINEYDVVEICVDMKEEEYFEKIVGLFHDTLEDTETTYDELAGNFGQSVADRVNMLTRRKDMSYMDYINSLKHNEVCRRVKIADLLHNMDLTRLNKITKEDIKRNRKYLKALEILVEMEG